MIALQNSLGRHCQDPGGTTSPSCSCLASPMASLTLPMTTTSGAIPPLEPPVPRAIRDGGSAPAQTRLLLFPPGLPDGQDLSCHQAHPQPAPHHTHGLTHPLWDHAPAWGCSAPMEQPYWGYSYKKPHSNKKQKLFSHRRSRNLKTSSKTSPMWRATESTAGGSWLLFLNQDVTGTRWVWASPGWHKGLAALAGNGTAELFCCLGRDGK